jgi:uncharacterized protein with PQ loop repeat
MLLLQAETAGTVIAAVSVLTVTFSMLAKVALGHQVALNWRRKTVTGVSIPFFIIGCLSYDFWVLSGILNRNPVLILGQAPGVILTAIIAGQAYLYRAGSRQEPAVHERSQE